MASADYSVLTPERVSLEYGIAGIGSRAGAAIVDTLIQIVGLTVVTVGLTAALAVAGVRGGLPVDEDTIGIVVLALWVLAAFTVTSGYFMVFEIVWNGQTPGKRLLNVRVIRESGYPIQPVDSVIRNLVRIVDWLPILYGFGALVMLFNKRAKRLGDFAAGTMVVREGASQTLSAVTPMAATPEQPRTYALSAADATLVRDFLMRRDALEPKARSQLAHRLATVLAARYHLVPEANPETFLEQLTA
jgi:uncharacterized RDD family membrane protein YckC